MPAAAGQEQVFISFHAWVLELELIYFSQLPLHTYPILVSPSILAFFSFFQ